MQFFSSPRLALGALIGLSAAFSPLAYGQTVTTIPIIQGKGDATTMAGQLVTVEGVVTGDFQWREQLSGFFIQDVKGDGDPATSDGIFVHVNARSKADGIDVKVGDRVKVTGEVAEFDNETQIAQVAAIDILGQEKLPAPVALTLPLATGSSFENVEGMLVTFPQKLTVSNNYELDTYGSLGVSLDRLFVPTNLKALGEKSEDEALRSFILDDGSDAKDPEATPYLDANGSRRTGSSVSGIIGILSYGHKSYRVHPTTAPVFEETNPRPVAPAAVGGTLKVGAANVLNYFTSFQDANPRARGAKNAEEFARQSAKVIAELRGLDADVLGIMEVQNNGNEAIGDIVTKLNAAYGTETYAYINDDPQAIGTDLIKVALIYKIAAVTPRGNPVVKKDAAFERYPLAQTFVSKANGAVFTVVVNHFKSKSPGRETVDIDKGEGAFTQRRISQAKSLLEFVNSLKQSTGDPDVLAIGDLNSYAEESPILALREGGLSHLNLLVPTADRFSYVFGGRSGSLDHAVATPELAKQVTGFAEWHINADEPVFMEYGKLTAENFKANPYRASDHDPLLVGLNLTP
ncbi:ExeM/NucH family extracellular endonuclease [bacterium]|nr:MAG: ExeM/NucH family extracellular endonuclease [bacterium]